jgi:hypothetical protein
MRTGKRRTASRLRPAPITNVAAGAIPFLDVLALILADRVFAEMRAVSNPGGSSNATPPGHPQRTKAHRSGRLPSSSTRSSNSGNLQP